MIHLYDHLKLSFATAGAGMGKGEVKVHCPNLGQLSDLMERDSTLLTWIYHSMTCVS